MFVRKDYRGRSVYRSKGTLYLWHKDNIGSISAEDVEVGCNMYMSVYDHIVVDGYDGRVGKPEDFHEKLEVEYEWTIPSNSEEFRYINEDGEVDYCEAMWVEITHIVKHTCKTQLEYLESCLREETGLNLFIIDETTSIKRNLIRNDNDRVITIVARCNHNELDWESCQIVDRIIKEVLGNDFSVHQPFCLNCNNSEAVYTNIPCEIIPSMKTW